LFGDELQGDPSNLVKMVRVGCLCSGPPKRDVGIRGTLRYEHGVAVERPPQPKVTRSMDTFSEVSVRRLARVFWSVASLRLMSVVG
jgi:hypothetical protein